MKRIKLPARPGYQARLEASGLSFHSWDDYWSETVAYEFTLAQVETIEAAAEELHQMAMSALKHVLATRQLGRLGIDARYHDAIAQAFSRRDFSLYGRFDLCYDGIHPPKLLELNYDTPTSLLETAVCGWEWLQDVLPQQDQFNSLHEKLIQQWRKLAPRHIHVATLQGNEEDWVTGAYLLDTLIQAGHTGHHIAVEEIGYDAERKVFVDLDGRDIRCIFMLYPWEWMMAEHFGPHIATSRTQFIEPMWKAPLSSKAILPVMWELFPGHPYLLPAYFDSGRLQSYARKPLYSREGANVTLVQDGRVIAEDDGPYGKEGYIEQQLCLLPEFDGHYPVIGAWMVGDTAAGMTVRESPTPITTNMSQIVQHYFLSPKE